MDDFKCITLSPIVKSFILPGDEMFSDSYKMKLVDDVIYEVYGTLVSRSTDFGKKFDEKIS